MNCHMQVCNTMRRAVIAKNAGLTTWWLHQMWENADLRPHPVKTLKTSKDQVFAEKLVDIAGLCLSLLAMLLCAP